MPKIEEVVHPRGLNFANQRKVVILRDQGYTWADIRSRVVNLKKQKPSEDVVRRVYRLFNRRNGRVHYKYSQCGRKPHKATKEVCDFLERKLLSLRKKVVCTSANLQRILAKEMGIKLSQRYIRKILTARGYKWLPRSGARKYSREEKLKRLEFALPISRMSAERVNQKMSLAIDGVNLPVPPSDPVDRYNFCLTDEKLVWRKRSEGGANEELDAGDPFEKQRPLSRCLPLWGGISEGGYVDLIYHAAKKLSVDDWFGVVKDKILFHSIKGLQSSRRPGPYYVLADNEKFLKNKDIVKELKKQGIEMWHIPPRSPDLNPIERFWGWLKKELRRRELQDLVAKRPALGKMAYKIRVRGILRSRKAQEVAMRQAKTLQKVCKIVVKKKGAASGY